MTIHIKFIWTKYQPNQRSNQQRENVTKSELQTLEKVCSVTYREPWSLPKRRDLLYSMDACSAGFPIPNPPNLAGSATNDLSLSFWLTTLPL